MAAEGGDEDVATALARRLEGDAELVDDGRFSLDLARARDKLASFRLADPAALVLLLVEAGNLLPGCTGIEFRIRPGRTEVELVDAELEADALERLLDAALIDPEGLPAAERGPARARRALTLALDAALASPSLRHVELVVRDRQGLTRQLRVSAQGRREGAARGSGRAGLTLRFVRSWAPLLAERERALLHTRAGYSAVRLTLEGQRVDFEVPLADLEPRAELRDEGGAWRASVGWSAARTDAKILLLAHGVIVEELEQEDWEPGSLALVEAGDLRRDLSTTRFVRDAAFADRIAGIRAHHAELELPAAPAAIFAPEVIVELPGAPRFLLAFGALAALVTLALALLTSVFWPPIIIGAMFVAVLGHVLEVGMRGANVHRRGVAGVAEVRQRELPPGGGSASTSAGTVELEVALPDRAPYRVRLRVRGTQLDLARLETHARLCVRADPQTPERLVFAQRV